MDNLITDFNQVKTDIEKIIKTQLTLGYFIDWDEWFENYFNPINAQYDQLYQEIKNSNIPNKPQYTNFAAKMEAIMINDCDMKLYE